MNLLYLILIGIFLLLLGYFTYGFFLQRVFHLDKNAQTPAYRFFDNRDFVPANRFYLLGQHLSAIAAAGPIVGTILAGMWFGWLPAMLWIILGGIFIGGVHDMASIVGSARHMGKSIAQIINQYISRKAFILFLLFLWLSLIYVITAFTDITSSTFIDKEAGSQVASSSVMYLALALLMGLILKCIKLPLWASTLIFIPLVFLCIYLGPLFPLKIAPLPGYNLQTTWNIILLVYCFFASVIPVWMLLQPRGYLGGFFLSFTAGISFLGIIIGSFTKKLVIQYPAFTNWANPQGIPLVPILFTTVACGAVSGFHSIVSAGTTSKQISKETDARLIGYGGMLLESFVALIALGTLIILSPVVTQSLKDPNQIYANGIAVFLNNMGIDIKFARNFALLAFATFVYDTLDVATRLGRYIFQELTGWHNRPGSYIATLVTLTLPFFLVTSRITDSDGNFVPVWKIFWTVFGSSNQLLAAMVLLGLSVWMFKKKMRFMVTLLPAIFMIIIAIVSLFFILKGAGTYPILITCGCLLILASLLVIETIRIFVRPVRDNSSTVL